MSEFTDGILFLKPNFAEVETAAKELSQPYLLREVNQKWGGLFAEDSNVAEPKFKNWLHTLSKQVSLFYFQHPADHGWGYNLYRDGKEVASVWVSYELSYNMAVDLAEIRYPTIPDIHVNLESDIFDSLLDEVRDSQEYVAAINQQYANKNVAEFAIFDTTSETISDLEDIVSENLYLEDMLEQVELFKTQLDITEMDWMSYRYLLHNRQ